MKEILGILAFSLFASTAQGAATYTTGTITNFSSSSAGLMIMTSGPLPDNCIGTPYGWLLIKQDSKAMTATVLLFKTKHPGATATVYTSGPEVPGGFCVVNQFHPAAL